MAADEAVNGVTGGAEDMPGGAEDMPGGAEDMPESTEDMPGTRQGARGGCAGGVRVTGPGTPHRW